MGKRIDELPLDDTPFDLTPKDLAATDPRDFAWYQFLIDIEELLATGHYTWAQGTLEGIQETVTRTECVTEGQRAAVANIAASRSRGGSRRYEGFRRGRR